MADEHQMRYGFVVTRYHRWEDQDGEWTFDNLDDALKHFNKLLVKLPATHALDITAHVKNESPEEPVKGDE